MPSVMKTLRGRRLLVLLVVMGPWRSHMGRIEYNSDLSDHRNVTDPFRARHGVTVKETTKRQLPDVPFIVFVHADDLFLGKTK